MTDPIVVCTSVAAPPSVVWQAYTDPEMVLQWNAATDDWHTTAAHNDVREGGSFLYRMEAKDGSAGFDFTGIYTDVVERELIAYRMDDGRTVRVLFVATDGNTTVTVQFDPETENSHELQRRGWQAILDNFKRFVERSVA